MERMPRSVDAIVESQVQRWLAERAKSIGDRATTAPVITVSREYGARGAAVARVVAERLGFSFWNRELLAAIAAHAHAAPSALAPYDEHHGSALIETMSNMIPHATPMSRGDYARELRAVVGEIAGRGAAVLVGRGLGFLIDPARCLRVRVVCPLEQRVRGLIERDGGSVETVRARVAEADRDRADFVRDVFGGDVADPAAYDLWLNSGSLGIDAAAAVVVTAYRHRFGDPPALARSAGR